MNSILKVLLCSPYLASDDIVKGGINTWGRYIIEYAANDGKADVEIVPISFDRHVISLDRTSILGRIYNGVKAYKIPVTNAIASMKASNPDVIHLCTSAGYGLFRDILLLRKAKRLGIKSVAHFHFGRIPELKHQNNWEWKLICKVIKLCDSVIVMNRPSEKTLLDAGFTNIKYLPNPLAMNVLERIEGMKGNYTRISRRLLYAGHVIKTKGVYELVEACSQISNIELRILGKCLPDVETELNNIASKIDDGKWLKIVGEVNHERVLAELLQADMLVFPSYTEGFPNVILEAMACGCPIVSSDVGAIPEMLDVDNISCGLCIKPKSVEQILSAVNRLLGDNALKTELVINASKRLNSEYRMPKVWDKLICIWNDASNEY